VVIGIHWLPVLAVSSFVITVVPAIPQMLTTLRNDDLTGISVWSWRIITLGGLLWVVDGLLTKDLVLTLSCAASLPVCVVILWRLHRHRQVTLTHQRQNVTDKTGRVSAP